MDYDPLMPKTALVTGAARRVGRAIALGLAADGWDVAVHYNRSAAEAEEVVGAIAAMGRRAVALPAALGREDEVERLLPAAGEALGPIGLLVNNASVFEHDDILTASRSSWDKHMEANLRAPFVLIQSFAHQLPKGARGAVVNLLDQRVWKLTPEFLSYTVSRSALWTLTRTLALALAPRIRVNAIGPGPTLKSTRQTEAQFEAQWRAVALARQTQPEEIADGVKFLASTPAMTGQMIALDGGEHLGWAQPSRGFVADE